MTQHDSLGQGRWGTFTFDQQVLMIANEMNRASKLMAPGDRERRRNAYARVLRLTDLTIMARAERGPRRELLRWRDLIAHLFVEPDENAMAHTAAFRCLLTFTVVAARQRAHLPHTGGARA